jgi:hypothetical protein
MSSPTSVRLPSKIEARLQDFIKRSGIAKSAVISRAVGEWLDTQAYPDICFVTAAGGERRAALVDGPEIWSVAEAWAAQPATGRSVAAVAESTGLETGQVEHALGYWADHREEIDGLVDRIHAAQDQELAAWERRHQLEAVA